MSRDLELLDPVFRDNVDALLSECWGVCIEMRQFYTLRDPWEQAGLWRQSRPTKYINKKIMWLKNQGAPWVAEVLDSIGPKNGPNVTGALPGESWHQYGKAIDCFWCYDGRAIWNANETREIRDKEVNGYKVYWEVAAKLGLTTITYGGGIRDWPHVQGPEDGSPRSLYSWKEIDALMRERFG